MTDSPSSPSLWGEVRRSLRGQQFDYTTGPIGRAVVLLAVPMVLELAMESLFTLVDIFWVAKLGTDAVATVGLTESMLTIVFAVAIGLSMGATAMVARRVGEGNLDGAVRAATQAVIIGLLAGLLLGLPSWFLAGDYLRWMGAGEEVIAGGTGYARILLGFNGVITLLFLQNAVFRGAGDPVIAMRVLWAANGLNMILDPLLIFGWGPFPELGLEGAAVATTIGRGSGVLIQFWCLRRGVGRVRLRGPSFRFVPKVMQEMVRLSAFGIIQMFIATSSWIVLMSIVADFGETAVAGYTFAIRIIIFTILPAWGLSNAAATLVGQNLGAGKPERAARSVWITGVANMAFLGLVMVVFLLFGPFLVSLFTDEAASREIGAEALRVLSYGYVAYGWGMVIGSAFNGAGDTVTPTKINFVCFWMLQIPGAYLLAHTLGAGVSGVFWAVAGSETLLALIALWLFREGRWQTTRIAADEPGSGAVPAPAPVAGELSEKGP